MTWLGAAMGTFLSALSETILRPKFATDVGILTIANTLGAVLSLVQGIVVARLLGPESYGVAALVMTYPGLLYALFDARSSDASIKYLGEFHAQRLRDYALAMCKVGYATDVTVASVAFIVVFMTANFATEHFTHESKHADLMILYAAALIPQGLVGTSHAVLSTLARFRTIALVTLCASSVRLVAVVSLVFNGWDIAGIIWGNAIGMILSGCAFGTVGFLAQKEEWGGSWLQVKWKTLKGRGWEIGAFLTYNNLNALLGLIPKQLDVLMLGYFRSPTEVGWYKIARSIAGVIGIVVGPLQSTAYPDLSRSYGLGNARAARAQARAYAVQIGLPLALLAASMTIPASVVLPSLVGDAYRPAVQALELLLFSSAIWVACFWLRPLYLAAGQIKAWTTISAVTSILCLGGFLVFIPSYGFMGLAVWLLTVTFLQHALAIVVWQTMGAPKLTEQ